jgi:hypothetical protein
LPDESRHFLQSNNETILNVDVIGEKALIKSAILSENLQEIPEQAFFNSQLTSVTIPSSVTTIGYRAFSYSQLTSVVIPNSVTTIGNNAFANTQLTSVTIPNSVTTIGNYAFSGTRLTSVVIPDSVTTIGNNVFSGCSQLTSVTIHNSVTIGIYSFFSAPIQLIKINCNNPGNNNIVKVLTHVTSYSDVHAIQIALSPSLLESFETDTNLKDYVQEILRIEDFNGYGIIYALQYYSAIFELDLSNTDLVQADINEMTKTLPWRVIFKNGQVDYAITPQ